MRIPRNQTKKYDLIGEEINFMDGTKVLECGKISGFTADSVIVVTQDDVEGMEVSPEHVYLPDEE